MSTSTMRRRPLRAFIAALAVAALAACGSGGGDADPASESSSTVRLGWLKSTADLAAYRAPEHIEGVELESTLFTTAVDVQTALSSGQIDIGMLTPVHLLRAVDQGQDLIQVAGNTRGNSGIVLSKELGLEQDDWDGLKEILSERKLKIAASRGSINEALAVASLEAQGIDVSEDIELVNIANFAQHPEGVRLGEFDGAFTMETFVSLMTGGGYATLFHKPYETAAGDINTIFVANKTWADKNPDAVQAFVQAIHDVGAELTADPELEIEVGTELMGLDRDLIELALKNNRYELSVGLEETKELARIQQSLGILERDLTGEVENYVTTKFIDAVTK